MFSFQMKKSSVEIIQNSTSCKHYFFHTIVMSGGLLSYHNDFQNALKNSETITELYVLKGKLVSSLDLVCTYKISIGV